MTRSLRHPGMYLAEGIRAMVASAFVALLTTIRVDRQVRALGRLSGPCE